MRAMSSLYLGFHENLKFHGSKWLVILLLNEWIFALDFSEAIVGSAFCLINYYLIEISNR